ncbi:type IX secretion system sortase PorU [candidate division KSB1 bacterium]|nr:type IX secretion system sortase PorU [candidate division KSB1 bacterium]
MAEESIQALSTTERQLILEFQPAEWMLDSLKIEQVSYLRVDFPGAQYDNGEAGAPLLPFTTTLIGIPSTGEIRVSVQSVQFHDVNLLPIPTPALIKKDDFPTREYKINPALYNRSETIPSDLVRVKETGYFRSQRVATIQINPVQAILGAKKLRLYDKIVVTVEFPATGTSAIQSMANIESDEYFYEAGLLNYEQARNWRNQSRPKLAKSTSRLAATSMYKIPIIREGIYQLTGSFLKSKGINLAQISVNDLKIFNNGGRELPTNLNSTRPDSLIENAIEVIDGGDNKFDEGDFVLFYGRPVNFFEFDTTAGFFHHYSNRYTKENIYWLTWGDGKPGKRIKSTASLSDPTIPLQTAFWDFYFLEDERTNVFHSGSNWFGDYFNPSNPAQAYKILLPGALPESSAQFFIQFFGISEYYGRSHQFTISINNKRLANHTFTGIAKMSRYETVVEKALLDGLNTLELKYTTTDNFSASFIDWFEIQYQRAFKASSNELFFNAPIQNSPVRYQIADFTSSDITVYDLSDFANIQKISNTVISNNSVSFADSCDPVLPKRYAAFTSKGYHPVTTLQVDEASDLRNPTNGAHYIVVTHKDFKTEAQRLAQHREKNDGLRSIVVDIQDIYDEFAWGLVDAAAIRDFLKFAYDYWSIRPELVFLFGDGNYDYKNNLGNSYPCWIPPYETNELDEIASRAMDDWFTYLIGNDEYGDMAIGRAPIQSATDARILVDKILKYESHSSYGVWKNTFTMLADDEYQKGKEETWNIIHITDAEKLVNYYLPQTFDVKKIYLTEYPAVQSASISGIRKPLAGEDLINQINRGSLIVNFIGHGNETVLTDERVLTLSESIERFDNEERFPFWIAATCAWGRWDMPAAQSMSEQILLMENRGAIGLLTATREAYAPENAALNQQFFYSVFPKDASGKYLHGETRRVGVGLVLAKNRTRSNSNDQKYHILGDPALKLAIPQYRAAIQTLQPDTLKALSKIHLTGVIYRDTEKWSDFNGRAFITAFDSKKKKIYLTPSEASIYYELPGSPVFRGSASVRQGEFEMDFIVPKDITYGGSLGRVSVYFANESVDGSGKQDSLVVGGTATSMNDQEGPEIDVRFKGMNIGDGAVVGPKPVLAINLADSMSGINITGEIGHKITLMVDEDNDLKRDITEFFVFDENSHLRGSIEFPLASFLGTSSEGFDATVGLKPGEHSVTIKAWDNFNNSAQKTIHFTVINEGEFNISQMINYPNPFATQTAFTFFITHNAEVKIQVYTVAGRLIRTMTDYADAGFNYHYQWDGRDEIGDQVANGIYLYRISAKSLELNPSKTTEEIGRLVVMQ